ncbi:MAG: pentapeptide repeat-containing protein, partial [Pseudomonadota bacterium]
GRYNVLKSFQINKLELFEKITKGVASFRQTLFVKGCYDKLQLDGVDFGGSNFREAIIDYSSFVKANLDMVHFNRVYGQGANFVRATLDSARMWMATLNHCNFSEALMRCLWAIEANFTNSIFKGADLSGSNLAGANFTGADLTDAKMFNVDLTSTIFKGARLCRTALCGANLFSADFRGVAQWEDVMTDAKTCSDKAQWDDSMKSRGEKFFALLAQA